VVTRALATGTQQEQNYDAIVIANGHFAVPFIPDLPGIREWNAENPGVISHSKFYRRPDEFRDKVRITVATAQSQTSTSAIPS